MISFKKIVAAALSVGVLTASFNVICAENTSAADSVDEEIIVGEYNFDNILNYLDTNGRFLQDTVPQVKPLEGGVQLEIGARSDGANGNTGWYGENMGGEHSYAASANLGQYVTSARGPFMSFDIDESVTSGKRVGLKFDYYPTNGTGNTADLYLYDPTAGQNVIQLIVGTELMENEWNSIEFYVDVSGETTLIVNNTIIPTSAMTPSTYPQLKFTEVGSEKDQQSRGRIDNVVLSTGGQLTDEQILQIVVSGTDIDTTQDGISLSDDGESYDVRSSFNLPTSDTATITWSAEQQLKSGGDWEPTSFVAINNGTVQVNATSDVSNYNIRLIATFTYNDATAEKEFNLNVKSPDDILNEYADTLQLVDKNSGEVIEPDDNDIYRITGDLTLDQGDGLVTVRWNCYKEETVTVTDEEGNESQVQEWRDSSIINSNGTLFATDYTGELRLTATLSFNGVTHTKNFTVASAVNSITDYIDPVIAELTATSADDSTIIYEDAKNIGTINNDIILPTNVEVEDGDVKIEWKVVLGESNATVNENGLVTIMTSDFETHDVELVATLTYVKESVNVISKEDTGYKLGVAFTEDDVASEEAVLDKYKVRFDAAYDANFSSIPTSTTSNITLPQTGHFGSAITWNSDAPAIISNTGTVSQANATRTVNLTATILKGASSETKTFAITVAGKGNNGGGGGGGSTSSTGTSSGGGGGGAIASSNGSNTSLTKPTTGQEKVEELIEQREEAENRFSDLGGVSWARDAINGLYDAGIVNGKTDTLFAPNDNVTRAEFAKMLMGVFGLTSDAFTTSSFYDVPSDSWYFQSVESAYNLGIINGVAAGYFDPNANITRQDMAVMVMRAATVSGRTISATTEAKSFNDADSIADYAKEAVTTLQTGGIINGVSDTEFAPLSNATRAQAAQILYSFL